MISVIVPVYNTEKYLHRCIDSVLAQTFPDFELLLIDDGSTDSSGAICDEYAAKDGRVRVFHKENGGVSSARNLGLDNAQGEWITFVDSDDYLESQYLQRFDINNANVDFHCAHIQVEGWDEWQSIPLKDKIWDDFPKFLTENLRRLNFPFAKLFRLSIIRRENIRFDVQIRYGEDTLFVYSYLCNANCAQSYSFDLYHYVCENSNSLSKKHYEWEIYEYTLNRICSQIEKLENKYNWKGKEDKCIIAMCFVNMCIRYIRLNLSKKEITKTLQVIFENKYARLQIFDRDTYKKSLSRLLFDFLMKRRYFKLCSSFLYYSRYIC